MRTLESILEEHPFFQGLAPEAIKVLVGCAFNTRFDAGQVIFREGEEANTFYLLREGKVALETFAPHRGPIAIQTIGQGDVLGWSWLFPPYRWHFDARVLEPVRALALDGACVRGKCEEDHDLGYEMMSRFGRIMMERLQATRLQLLDVYGTEGLTQ